MSEQFTAKQERNGTNIGGVGHNTAVDDKAAMPDVGPVMDKAMAVGAEYSGYGAEVFSGADISHEDLVIGSTFEWADGLAVEQGPDELGGGAG